MDTSISEKPALRPLDVILGRRIPRDLLSKEDWVRLFLSAWSDLYASVFYLHGYGDINEFQKCLLRLNGLGPYVSGDMEGASIKLDPPEKDRYIPICRLPPEPTDHEAMEGKGKEWYVCARGLALARSAKFVTFFVKYRGVNIGSGLTFSPSYKPTDIRITETEVSLLPLDTKVVVPVNRFGRPTDITTETPLGGLILDGLARAFSETIRDLESRKSNLQEHFRRFERWHEML